jgi:glyceraldehyde 3-phosphate dehydrogenase
MSVKIAINGFGRIGRLALKRALQNHPGLEIVAINDLTDPKTLAHLLKYDSVYGIFSKPIQFNEKSLSVEGKEIRIFAEKDPAKLPWKDLGIDVVLECTGLFTDYEGAKKHLEAGAKFVIISAPSKDPAKIPSYVLGVNADKFDPKKDKICDMGSCTTNCLAPLARFLNENYKIVRGFMTTVHSYTNDQKILDLPHKDLRRARAAALNIIPTTTGAARAIGNVIPELKGKLDGMALRVPTPTVSILDLVCQIEKAATAEELNYEMKKFSQKEELVGIFGVEDAQLVSSDYQGNSFSSIVDSSLTMANGNLVKITAWYDNEWGYSTRLAEFAEFIGKKI